MSRKRIGRRAALVRALIQVFFFVMMPGAFVAGFSGVKNIFEHIAAGSVLEWNSFVRALVGLCGFTVIFGRFFCGYACAFGSFGDLIWRISGFIQLRIFRRKKQIRMPDRMIPWAQKIKFVILALIVIGCAVGFYERLAAYNWNPWSVFSFLAALRFELNGYVAGALILAAIVAGMALKERFFCQFLCPLGAVFALLPQMPFALLARDGENCIKGCNLCRRSCPVDLKLERDGFRNGECISCERCAGVCPRGNLTRWDRTLFGGAIVPALIKAALLFALGAWLGLVRFI